MKQIIFFLMLLAVFTTTGTAVVVFQDDFEDRTPGSAAGGWNWNDGASTHTATFETVDGSIVRQQRAEINNTGTADQNTRFGSKWDITVSGNTSPNPEDYTLEFDIRNLEGDWNPHRIEVWLVTNNPAQGTDQYGHGFPTLELTQEQGWVHVKFNLSEATKNWWQGTNWDLTNPTWSLEFGGPEWPGMAVAPGQSWTQTFLLDNIKITMGPDLGPHDPTYVPLNEDGTVGSLMGSYARFKLAWMAGGDPNMAREYPVNPDIRGYYIYLSRGVASDDPNIHLLDYKPQVHNEDPYLTDPYNEYGYINRKADTTYYWRVEQAMDDGTGNPLPAGDPNNIWGPLWSFRTISITPYIMTHPEDTVADLSGNASFTAKGSASATHYRWYKVDTPDIEMAEGALAPDKTTTLNITGATLADEGLYYCIVYYGNPDTGGTPSAPSDQARLWTSRLIGHWKFDGDLTDSVASSVPGAPVHDAFMKTGTANFVSETTDSAIVGTDALRIYPDGEFALLPDADYFNYYPGGFTISLWYKEYTPQPPGNVFLSKFDAGTSGWLLRSYDGENSAGDFIIENTGSLAYAAIGDNQWNLLTVTYNPATQVLRTYTNGQLTNQTTIDLSALPVPASAVEIGGEDTWETDVTGDIAIDDLKMYSYPLSTEEIAQYYLAYSGAEWVCNYEAYDLLYDFDGNCRVDLADLAFLAATWLDSYRIYPNP